MKKNLFIYSLISSVAFTGSALAEETFAQSFKSNPVVEYFEDVVLDSKVTLDFKNMFVNAHNAQKNTNKNDAQEWGQGYILGYQSGYTKGPLGFGFDALSRGVVRLTGDGKRGAPDEKRNPGQLFPV